MPKGSDNPFPSVLVVEGSTPASPSAGDQRLFLDSSSHHLKRVNSSGTVVDIESGGTALVGAQYLRTAGNYTTTSTTFVDIDSTNLKFTLTTGAHHVMLGLTAGVSVSSGPCLTPFDIAVDGTRLGGGTYGLYPWWNSTSTNLVGISFTAMTGALTAASHTFEFQWYTATGTATLHASSGAESQLVAWAVEMPF